MKLLSNLLLLVLFAVSSFSLLPTRTDVADLRGGAAFQGQVNEGEIKKKKFNCKDECANSHGCVTSNCVYLSNGVCSEVIREFSGQCEEADSGILESCTTRPANDYCFKDMRSRCTPENVTCTRQHAGCGSKSICS